MSYWGEGWLVKIRTDLKPKYLFYIHIWYLYISYHLVSFLLKFLLLTPFHVWNWIMTVCGVELIVAATFLSVEHLSPHILTHILSPLTSSNISNICINLHLVSFFNLFKKSMFKSKLFQSIVSILFKVIVKQITLNINFYIYYIRKWVCLLTYCQF